MVSKQCLRVRVVEWQCNLVNTIQVPEAAIERQVLRFDTHAAKLAIGLIDWQHVWQPICSPAGICGTSNFLHMSMSTCPPAHTYSI